MSIITIDSFERTSSRSIATDTKAPTYEVQSSKKPASLLTLHSIFEERFFSIPDYQRGYSWDLEQVKALHKDIEQLFNANYLHFTGTIVMTKDDADLRNKCGKGMVYEIVDGQQRLTTLYILLNELIRGLDSEKLKSKSFKRFIRRGEKGNEINVFTLNTHINPYFHYHVIEDRNEPKNIEYFSEKRLKACKKETKKWIKNMIEVKDRTYHELFNLVTTKLGFILYLPENSLEAGMMFEVINNRGKELSELEKVKNYLIYYSIKKNKSALRSTINECWGEILKNLASAHLLQSLDETGFLRGVSITFLGLNKTQASNIYSTIKKKYPIDNDNPEAWEDLKEFVLFMKNCSFYYDALLNEKSKYRNKLDKNIIEYIELIGSQTSHAAIMPIYFALMERKKDVLLNKNELLDAFRMLEVANFRIYMARNGASRSNAGQGWLFYLAHKFFKGSYDGSWVNELNDKNEGYIYHTALGALIGGLYDVVDEHANTASFEKGLVLSEEDKFDFYKWTGLRYFLMLYEKEINPKKTIKVENILMRRDEKVNNYLSVEHIWAVANNVKGNKKNVNNYHKRRLGNFVLLELGINIQANNKDLKEKMGIYKGNNSGGDSSSLKQISHLIDDFKKAEVEVLDKRSRRTSNFYIDINVGMIDRIEKRLVKFAVERWSTDWAEKYWDEF